MEATDKDFEPKGLSDAVMVDQYIHVDGDRYDKMKAAADAAAWRSGNRAAIMVYLIHIDPQQAWSFWDHSHQFKAADELDNYLESEMTKLANSLSQADYAEVEKEATRVWRDSLASIPYGTGFDTRLFIRLKEMPLQEIGPYLNYLCNKRCHPGLPNYFILNTATDAAYLRDILTQQLKDNSHAGQEAIMRAIQWLTEQAKRALPTPKTNDLEISKSNHKGRQPDVVELHDIDLDKIRFIFTAIKMGSLYNQSGEWAAAFAALKSRHYLKGNSRAIDRWAIECKFEGRSSKSTRETLKTYLDFTESEQFTGSRKSVFVGVTQELDKYENSKKQTQ